MMATVNSEDFESKHVRLTPSTAMEPFSTVTFLAAGSYSKVYSQLPLAFFQRLKDSGLINMTLDDVSIEATIVQHTPFKIYPCHLFVMPSN